MLDLVKPARARRRLAGRSRQAGVEAGNGLLGAQPVARSIIAITSNAEEASMNVALILVSLGIANAPEPISHPLVVSYFEDMTSCVAAANQAKLPAAGTLGRSLNTWVQFVCVPAKPIVP